MEQWLDRYRGLLFFILVALALAGLILFQLLRPEPPGVVLTSSPPLPSPQATSTPHPLRVYVSGAVQQPDVYSLPPDSIVKDAIVAAGGSSDDADLDRINLALAVADGQHVYVPRLGEQQLAVEPPGNPSTSGGIININTANAAELEVLPAIGPSIAQRICDYRDAHGPFGRIEDIMEVSHWPGHVCQDTRPDYD
jgi:competence protein ComEA